MPIFSRHFKLGLSQPELDFIDITTDTDTKVFVDPFAISIRDDEWSLFCADHINSFFGVAIDYIRDNKEFEAKAILNSLSEPNETFLGLSRGRPQGKGVSGKQAGDLYDKLANSSAAKTGLIAELAECDLFVDGIGPDKISDITTNIIRGPLIQYTTEQCELHNIPVSGQVAAGKVWNIQKARWESVYAPLPTVKGQKVLLVPKSIVRRRMCLDGQEYYNHHILNFLREEHLANDSPLVHVFKKSKERTVFKKTLRGKHPFDKEWMAQFSQKNPEVLEAYKAFYKNLPGADGVLKSSDFMEDFDESAFARSLIDTLSKIPPGDTDADRFHSFMVGALEFIFWPHLTNPRKERPINDGRKRIDITFTNAARDGYFHRAHDVKKIPCSMIMVECKNYSKDPANPEVDQIANRFSTNRGRLGMMIYRACSNRKTLVARCRDVASAGNGFVLPIGDEEVNRFLALIADGKRAQIDRALEEIHSLLIS